MRDSRFSLGRPMGAVVRAYLVWDENHDEPDGLAIEADSLREAARIWCSRTWGRNADYPMHFTLSVRAPDGRLHEVDIEVEACPEFHVSERKPSPDRKAAR